MNLVYCIAARKVDPASAPDKFAAVGRLLADLQAAPTARLWPQALTALARPHNPTYPALQQVVAQLVECMFLESDLRAKWVREAISPGTSEHICELSREQLQSCAALACARDLQLQGDRCMLALQLLHHAPQSVHPRLDQQGRALDAKSCACSARSR